MNGSNEVEGYLPLKPVVFHILAALSESESHGYGVIRAVRDRSTGRIRLQTGAFYRHLRRLLEDGLVEEAGGGPPDDDPRRGAYYRLTAEGRAVVRAEWRRMAELVASTRELGLASDEERA
jgi:DNA-binding PadR family transcriptional regulator